MGAINAKEIISDPALTAAEALPLLTTGALARKKSDGTMENGPMDFTVANDFDPQVAPGYAAPLGSAMRTTDGTTNWWVKIGPTATEWRSLKEVEYSDTLAAGPAQSFDLNLDLPTNRMAVITMVGRKTSGAFWTQLRINGATATGSGLLNAINAYTIEWDKRLMAIDSARECGCRITICKKIGSADVRQFSIVPWVESSTISQDSYCRRSWGGLTVGAITSVGILDENANTIANGFTIKAIVFDRTVTL